MAEKKRAPANGGGRRRKPRQQPPAQAAAGAQVETESEDTRAFVPADLDRTVIALPLLNKIDEDGESAVQDIVVDANLEYPGGRDGARERICRLIRHLVRTRAGRSKEQGVRSRTKFSQQYVFASLSGALIRELVRLDRDAEPVPVDGNTRKRDTPQSNALYRIWPDFPVERFTNRSIATVKADAARNAFGALGEGIVWAVIDSGIDRDHPHFAAFKNLDLEPPLCHCDFTALEDLDDAASSARACTDEAGHGTHVAGIIAGSLTAGADPNNNGARTRIVAKVNTRNELGEVKTEAIKTIPAISGMAPRCKLVSLKVLNAKAQGQVSSLIAALEWIQQVNGYGRRLRIHGVNMSVGYDFEPKWFACGQSPLCVEVDRLVKTGVVVVVAAGNTGYGWNQTAFRGAVAAGMDLSINDPGNADLAITVGSTHRHMPHTYGVSYFSSKGPTGDGRLKPDLVAPGEKIVSCEANGRAAEPASGGDRPPAGDAGGGQGEPSKDVVGCYKEDSGTSMAAPHVSGAIAAFLSVRREFIGRAEEVKRIFTSTATDLGRDRHFQGCGLVDLMRAIQSV